MHNLSEPDNFGPVQADMSAAACQPVKSLKRDNHLSGSLASAFKQKPKVFGLIAAAGLSVLVFLLIKLLGILNIGVPAEAQLEFHSISEYASIIVSFAIFFIGWYGHKQRPNSRSLFIAMPFFAIGALDFAHTFYSQTTQSFAPEATLTGATAWWTAARLIFPAAILAAVFIPSRAPQKWLHPWVLLAFTGSLVTVPVVLGKALPASIFFDYWRHLAEFKTGLDYSIVIMLAAAILILLWRPLFDLKSTIYMQSAALLSIFSLSFTFRANGFDDSNLLGHIYKLMSDYLVLQAIFVTSLREPYQELNKARAILERSFKRVGTALSSSLELNKTLELIAELAADMLRAPCALVALKKGGDDQHLEVMATWGLELAPQEISLDCGLAAEAWRTQKTVMDNNLTTCPLQCQPLPGIVEGSLRSVIAAPIVKGSSVLGVIQICSSHSRAFKKEKAQLLAAFAKHAAAAIDNSRLYQNELESRARIQSYATQLSLLHDLSLSFNKETDKTRLLKAVLEGAAELTMAGTGALMLIDDDKPKISAVYFAPWQKDRSLWHEARKLHDTLATFLADSSRYVIRIGSGREENGHWPKLPRELAGMGGLLIGVIRNQRGQMRGYFLLSSKIQGARFTPVDEEIITLLAAQSSVALVGAETLEREQSVAEILQTSLLPSAPPRSDMEIGLLYRPADPHGKVGGDFYDFIELDDDRLAIVVGDVCGKGVEAATHTAMIKYTLRSYFKEGRSPGECLTRLNSTICRELSPEKFVTIGMAVIDRERGKMVYSSAGHPPALICRDGSARPIYSPNSLPMGVLPEHDFICSEVNITEGCGILLYTDGLSEARPHKGNPWGQKNILRAASNLCHLHPQLLVDDLLDSALFYSNNQLRDDIALVAARIT